MKHKRSNIEFCLGIDISKPDFHVALLRNEDEKIIAQATFDNKASGFAKLHKWLLKHTGEKLSVHICLEATGSYGDGVSFYLTEKVARLSVINPRAIKAHGDSDLRRCKSDSADARLIADFCLCKHPSAWIPPTPEQQNTKAISRRINTLKKMLIQEQNRLEITSDKDTKKDLKEHIKFIEKHIEKLDEKLLSSIKANTELIKQHELITSIPGIGDRSAAYLLAEIMDISIYTGARQLSAHAGVTPKIFQSGTSGKVRTPMSRAGNSYIRGMLFFPAMSARRFNPICKVFADRLEAKGKGKLEIIGAIMHKLLHLIYGVLKHQKPFNPNHLIAGIESSSIPQE